MNTSLFQASRYPGTGTLKFGTPGKVGRGQNLNKVSPEARYAFFDVQGGQSMHEFVWLLAKFDRKIYLSKVLGANGIQQAFNVGALLLQAMNWTWRVGQGNQLHGQH